MPNAEADEKIGQEAPRRAGRFEASPRAPEQPQAEGGDRIHEQMEVAVHQHLESDVLSPDGAQQMMPLQNLMQQDAVEEAAEGEAQPERRTCETGGSLRRCG